MRLWAPRNHGVGGGTSNIAKVVIRVDTDAGIHGLGEVDDFMGVRQAIARGGFHRRRDPHGGRHGRPDCRARIRPYEVHGLPGERRTWARHQRAGALRRPPHPPDRPGPASTCGNQYPSAPGQKQLPARLPFHELDNIIMTPHKPTAETMAYRWRAIPGNIARLARGEALLRVVHA